MPITLFVCALLAAPPAGGPAEAPSEKWAVLLRRASREPDLDGAGLALSPLLADGSLLRAAFSAPDDIDERSAYVLFGGHWGARAKVTWKDRTASRRILAESVAAQPALIRRVLRADRYAAAIDARAPRGAAALNAFPFTAYSPYADDLAERFIESLRVETTRPARPVESPFSHAVLLTADDVELNLLETWQLLCGLCGRLDLIDKATARNWRGRFPELDRWFRENRPFALWDDAASCLRVDEAAKRSATPTPRASRAIPGLTPPWLAGPPAPRRPGAAPDRP